ncbi:MAG: thioredoxin family protein [Parcubacteria group bacterium]|jgi:thiol-disulfide isomerase/thioredoxin
MTHKGGIKILLLLLIVIVIGLSATMFSFNDQNITEDVQNKAQEALKENGGKVIDRVAEEGRTAVGEKLKETGEKMLTVENDVPGVYQKFDESSIAKHEKNILFFTAPWCPSCVTAENDVTAEQKTIPTAVAIYAVDYDTNVQLREKYHVDKQHTFVQVDQAGNEIARWTNSTTLQDIISHIQ